MKFILSAPESINPKRFDELPYSEEEIAAASRIAKERGVNLLGHAYNSASIRLAIKYGIPRDLSLQFCR